MFEESPRASPTIDYDIIVIYGSPATGKTTLVRYIQDNIPKLKPYLTDTDWLIPYYRNRRGAGIIGIFEKETLELFKGAVRNFEPGPDTHLIIVTNLISIPESVLRYNTGLRTAVYVLTPKDRSIQFGKREDPEIHESWYQDGLKAIQHADTDHQARYMDNESVERELFQLKWDGDYWIDNGYKTGTQSGSKQHSL
jgi:hypothetical protein